MIVYLNGNISDLWFVQIAMVHGRGHRATAEPLCSGPCSDVCMTIENC